jgi:cellulose synthase/poly-beta-1,6-N-acetylglucosamine synthase-like glycosyltransferase
VSFAASVFCLLLGAVLGVPVAVLLAQCVLSTLRASGRSLPRGSSPRTVVLVPAHDEERVLGKTLAALTRDAPVWARVLVIADNCTDRTAELAREAGVEVLERHDPEHRGKGHALRFGLSHLQDEPPQVVVILDADCIVSSGGIAALAQLAHAEQRPIQADNVVEMTGHATIRSRISTFAFRVRNRLRPRGMARLGLPCHLAGTGMAVPFAQLATVSVPGSHLVEDMVLGLRLTLLGWPPMYTDMAHIVSVQPDDPSTALGQRRRWEHGHLRTLLSFGPTLLVRGLLRGSVDMVAMALDLLVPPLALLTVLIGCYVATAAAARLLLGLRWPLMLASAEALLLVAAVGLAWVLEGRSILKLHHFLLVPLYVAWKLPLYFALLLRRGQRNWQRTSRAEAGTAGRGPGTGSGVACAPVASTNELGAKSSRTPPVS